MSPSHEWEQAAEEEKALLAENPAGRRAEYPGVDIVQKAVRGDPAVALQTSRPAQSCPSSSASWPWRFRRDRARLVSHTLLHHAHCPVVVVRSQ